MHKYSMRTQPNGYLGIVIHHDAVQGPSFVSREAVLGQLGVVWVFRGSEAWEDDGDPSAYCLCTIKDSF
jgi:hypothetical protein